MEKIKTILKSSSNIKIIVASLFLAVSALFITMDSAQAAIIVGSSTSSASSRQINSGEQMRMNVSIYDSNGYSLVYSWNCNGGTLSDYYSSNPVYTAPIVSNSTTYVCTLTAGNSRGEKVYYPINIFVNANNNYVNYGNNLSVSLTASQSVGVSSLNNVSLTANVSGQNLSGLAYMFDCKNDNIWDLNVHTANTSYTATNLCNYSTPGTYTAKVRVESGNYFTENTATIYVAKPAIVAPVKPIVIAKPAVVSTVTTTPKTTVKSATTDVVLETLARNLTQNEIIWRNEVSANAGDEMEFNIIITPTGKASLSNINVKNILSSSIGSVSDIKVGEDAYTGSIDRINVGIIELGTSKVINFKAKVNSDQKLSYAINKIVNTSEVSVNNAITVKKDLIIDVAAGTQVASVSDFTSKAVGIYLAISIIILLAMLVIIFYLLVERKKLALEPVKVEAEVGTPEDLKINKSKYFVINS